MPFALSSVLSLLTSSACQNAPFTSCVDDGTPCDVNSSFDGVESNVTHGATTPAVEGSFSTTSPQTTSARSTAADNSGGVPTSAEPKHDAMVVQPDDAGGAVVDTDDASITTADDSLSATFGTTVPGDAAGISELSAPGSTAGETSTEELLTGASVITNGDFAAGVSAWKIEQTGGRSAVTTTDAGALCLESNGRTEFTIGWPADAAESANLQAGEYQLSFKVQGSGVEMDVKVGHAYEPYNALHELTWSATSDDWERQSSTFTTRGDDATGLAFFVRLSGGSLCIDDVTLSPVLDVEGPL